MQDILHDTSEWLHLHTSAAADAHINEVHHLDCNRRHTSAADQRRTHRGADHQSPRPRASGTMAPATPSIAHRPFISSASVKRSSEESVLPRPRGSCACACGAGGSAASFHVHAKVEYQAASHVNRYSQIRSWLGGPPGRKGCRSLHCSQIEVGKSGQNACKMLALSLR